jgi:hypothetical protein
MSKIVLALMGLMIVLVTGCAAKGGAMNSNVATADNGGLPDIAAYEEMVVEPLPDMIQAEIN